MTLWLQIAMGIALLLFGVVTVRRIQELRRVDERADALCGLAGRSAGDLALGEALYRSVLWQRAMAVLARLGFSTSGFGSQLYMALSPLVIGIAWVLGGWQAAGLCAVAAFSGNILVVRWLIARRARQFTQRLPVFLERVRRFVLIGNTFQQAFMQAAKDTDPLLKAYFGPVLRRVQHGASFVDSVDLMARQIGTREVYMFASYVRTNAKFGGRVAENLASLIGQIANRERLEREIAALTGETRASAFILLALTAGMIGFVSIANPSYMDFFLNDGTGKILFIVIILWPLLGLLVMKRILDIEL